MPDITDRKQPSHFLPGLITHTCTICQARPWPLLHCLLRPSPDCLQMKHRHHAPRVRPAPPSPTTSIRHITITAGKLCPPPPRRRPATAPAATATPPPTASSTSTSGPSWAAAAAPAGPCASPPTTSCSSSRKCHILHTTSPPPATPPATPPASTSGPRSANMMASTTRNQLYDRHTPP